MQQSGGGFIHKISISMLTIFTDNKIVMRFGNEFRHSLVWLHVWLLVTRFRALIYNNQSHHHNSLNHHKYMYYVLFMEKCHNICEGCMLHTFHRTASHSRTDCKTRSTSNQNPIISFCYKYFNWMMMKEKLYWSQSVWFITELWGISFKISCPFLLLYSYDFWKWSCECEINWKTV